MKILKVKPWMIKFENDGKIFFLKEMDETYEHFHSLYRYIPTDDKGHYKTEFLASINKPLKHIDYFGEYIPKSRAYKDYPYNIFWMELALNGFAEYVGKYPVDEISKEQLILKNELKKAQKDLKKDLEDIEKLYQAYKEQADIFSKPFREGMFKYVLEELKRCNIFIGIYDAKNGNSHFMNGISTVMEYIALEAGEHDEFYNEFLNNMIKSEEKINIK